jgi:hypothetical protein
LLRSVTGDVASESWTTPIDCYQLVIATYIGLVRQPGDMLSMFIEGPHGARLLFVVVGYMTWHTQQRSAKPPPAYRLISFHSDTPHDRSHDLALTAAERIVRACMRLILLPRCFLRLVTTLPWAHLDETFLYLKGRLGVQPFVIHTLVYVLQICATAFQQFIEGVLERRSCITWLVHAGIVASIWVM